MPNAFSISVPVVPVAQMSCSTRIALLYDAQSTRLCFWPSCATSAMRLRWFMVIIFWLMGYEGVRTEAAPATRLRQGIRGACSRPRNGLLLYVHPAAHEK